jgi:multidrug resistance protein MdtO
MWLVFDQLWGAPAAIEMRRKFISNLRLLAQLAREPLSQDRETAIARSLVLGETINANLDKVRALADGVLFEFGPSREQDLAVRDRIRQWQPTLRMLFITRIVLWRYRAGLPGFELPEAMQPAQQEFDNRLATALDELADRMGGKASTELDDLTTACTQLEQAAWTATPKQQHPTPQMQSFLLLSRRIADLADRVERNI